MKIIIETTARGIEVANCLLRIMTDELAKNDEARVHHKLTNRDVDAAIAFRKALVSSFLKDKS